MKSLAQLGRVEDSERLVRACGVGLIIRSRAQTVESVFLNCIIFHVTRDWDLSKSQLPHADNQTSRKFSTVLDLHCFGALSTSPSYLLLRSKALVLQMAQDAPNPDQVVLGEEIGHVRLITLNRPRQLNVISSKVVSLLAEFLEKWEKDDDAKLVVIKGNGRAFCAGGDLKMFYEGRSDDTCLEVVYRMYWLCYHIHTYKKPMVALVHGIVMGGGGAMSVPLKFSVVTEKTVFAVPEASVGLHTDCSFSYILSHLPGHLGEYLALTGARLNAKEMVAAGLATHFVPSEKLDKLEKHLLSLNSGDDTAIGAIIEEFSSEVQPDQESILNKLSIINKCFDKESLEEIIQSFETEARADGNEWIAAVLKGLKRSSPTGLKITLRSIREGRKQTLPECLKKEFRLTMNILRSVISGDVYEGIRALSIDKDNAPKWDPPSFEEVSSEKADLIFQPFEPELELQIPAEEACRWDGKYENTVYPRQHGEK